MSRDENKENNLADKVADKLFFYQTNEKITGQEIKKKQLKESFIYIFIKRRKKMSEQHKIKKLILIFLLLGIG